MILHYMESTLIKKKSIATIKVLIYLKYNKSDV